jgi:hypothetical protein
MAEVGVNILAETDPYVVLSRTRKMLAQRRWAVHFGDGKARECIIQIILERCL